MKSFITIILLLCSFTVFGQKFTPKVIEDSTKIRYNCFTIEQSRKLAEKIKTGEICEEKTKEMQKQINLLKENEEICDDLVDSLQVNYKKSNEIIVNQEKIIQNKDKEILLKQDIVDNDEKVIKKQEKKIIRRNNVIKILTGTNIIAIIVLAFIL